MKECLQEEVLQSYLDGELHQRRMAQVTAHLASCLTCSDLARQLEQENSVLAAALAPEFESAVPSERLRQRIDAAITSARIDAAAGNAAPVNVRNWLSSLSDLFTFRPQRAFAYASLMVIIGFGVIMAMMRWQISPTLPPTSVAVAPAPHAPNPAPTTTPLSNGSVTSRGIVPSSGALASVQNNRPPRSKAMIAPASSRQNESAANHVKLLPGERSYLQTIAQLDSTIKSDKSRMKPEVQAEYQRNLAFVDRTLAVARTAAKSNPNDPDATEFMFSAYQSKVDLLNTVAEARVFDK
ncbi:MAG TPA: zf-HC2 domain-containing protein [Pyrinomonadaceae bacterium]|nr:zf-HC2 domain-containing protein [Pyrinomonadaceae bacterium]